MLKTSDLEGRDLDAAVTMAEGRVVRRLGGRLMAEILPDGDTPDYDDPLPYSSDWRYGGPIIEQGRINLWNDGHGIRAAVYTRPMQAVVSYEGPTPLIAAMRAFVASKFGEEVKEPSDE